MVFVLILGSGAFMTLATTSGQIGNQAGGMLGLEILWLLIYLITFALLARHCPGFLRQIVREWPLSAFVALAVLSTLWSDDPSITFRRSIALCFTVMFGFYLARRFPLREQLHLLAWTCGICIFFSVPFQLLHVGSVVEVLPGTWHGVFVQKNVLGRMMALSAIVFLLLGKAEPDSRRRMRLGLIASLVLLILSHSATAIVVTVLMFTLFPLAGILRKSFGKAVAGMVLVTIGGVAAIFWVFTHLATFTDAFGKNVTMSGRVGVWALCVVMALQKPWLGYGYSAFWLGMHGPSYRIWEALGVQMPHAHNGFIQVWLDLGLLGLGLLILIFAVYAVRAATMVRRTSQPEEVWPLMVLAFCFLYILTEVTVPATNTTFMMIFSASVFAVAAPIGEATRELAGREFVHANSRAVRADMNLTAPGTSAV